MNIRSIVEDIEQDWLKLVSDRRAGRLRVIILLLRGDRGEGDMLGVVGLAVVVAVVGGGGVGVVASIGEAGIVTSPLALEAALRLREGGRRARVGLPLLLRLGRRPQVLEVRAEVWARAGDRGHGGGGGLLLEVVVVLGAGAGPGVLRVHRPRAAALRPVPHAGVSPHPPDLLPAVPFFSSTVLKPDDYFGLRKVTFQ